MRAYSQNLPLALLRAREAVMRRFRPILRNHGITEQQWRVIRALSDETEDGLEATQLAERTLLLMPSLTRILRGMEVSGLIHRTDVEGDNRRRRIRLSANGRDVFTKIAPLSEAEYERIEREIGTDNLDELYSHLHALGSDTE